MISFTALLRTLSALTASTLVAVAPAAVAAWEPTKPGICGPGGPARCRSMAPAQGVLTKNI